MSKKNKSKCDKSEVNEKINFADVGKAIYKGEE